MDNIKGKVIVITGASSGIGEATARKLSLEGGKVVLGARRTERLEKLAADLRKAGGEVAFQQTDVTNKTDVQALVQTAVEKYGHVDVLFNNAGLMPLSPLRDLKVEEWERMIDVNIKGVLYGIAAVLPMMREQKSGHIINTDSVAGYAVSRGGWAVYSGTKFAVRAIAEGLRLEESPYSGIRVTNVSPGAVQTELPSTITDPKIKKQVEEKEKFRGIKPEAIATAVAYAISQSDEVAINEVIVRPTAQQN
ncbi:SDR family oxidoreductase [Sporolactobacillus terrae]|uniref:Oxidoreductase n=1 Tax=Sporolactobacillus terrae TaxID=269673 RepID=A0ABX5Q4U2_9BACL|nr:SDR family oxidoreductase [Sporolactobacillus terrae]QAA21653.1 oxidoreductase [Sporolactobacillus terrae]QAA24625.1 oxidoreductase [Sporolactobacillus terrae]UAK16461.1 SDR family oxidoreductase [Sporolactobacillus terrae]